MSLQSRFFRSLVFMLTLSLSACLSESTVVRLIKLDEHHFQLKRVARKQLEPLTHAQIFVGSKSANLKSTSYHRHLHSFNPSTEVSEFEDFHTFEIDGNLGIGLRVEIRADSETLVGDIGQPKSHPGIHVDRIGYQEGRPGLVKLGLYLGQKELPLPDSASVRLVPLGKGTPQELTWKRTPESGYPYELNPNQEVGTIQLPGLGVGEYRLEVPAWGHSEEFSVSRTAALDSAQNYALGLYHQRCGRELKQPCTSWNRPACHLAPVFGADKAVVGGHHDAGDYGRYTHNSALAAHVLLFSADHWFDSKMPDNLGLPESGDGKSDLHQIALIELDFLLQMQRPDGLFWGRISPKDRAYESEVTADKAGPQRVHEGSSAVTAAAAAVLFQACRSPYLRKNWPEKTESCGVAAERAWQALQKVDFDKSDHHYGDVFKDKDERLWAFTERALLREEEMSEFEGEFQELRRWGWWPVFEGYGGAARAAAFGGRDSSVLTAALLGEIEAASNSWLEAHRSSAYGVTFPMASKRHQSAGWFFPHDYSFDLITSNLLQPSVEKVDAVWANWAYERGVNPLNQVFLTGHGRLSPRYLLHQQAINDNSELPPGGIPVGSMVTNIRFANVPQNVEFPLLRPGSEGKPLDQRYSDSPNVLSEATVVNQVRGLVVCAWLASRPVLQNQASPVPQELR